MDEDGLTSFDSRSFWELVRAIGGSQIATRPMPADFSFAKEEPVEWADGDPLDTPCVLPVEIPDTMVSQLESAISNGLLPIVREGSPRAAADGPPVREKTTRRVEYTRSLGSDHDVDQDTERHTLKYLYTQGMISTSLINYWRGGMERQEIVLLTNHWGIGTWRPGYRALIIPVDFSRQGCIALGPVSYDRDPEYGKDFGATKVLPRAPGTP